MKIMKWICLLCLLAVSAPALNFFGIEHDDNAADNLVNLIYGMVQGDDELVASCYRMLQKTDPDLAAELEVEDLKIPCIRCRGEGVFEDGRVCPLCDGDKTVADPQALGYLQHKFCAAIDDGALDKDAWAAAKADFDGRRALVLSMEPLFGTVIRQEEGGVLLTCNGNNERVYLKGSGSFVPSRKGTPIHGRVWPIGTYTFTGDDDQPVEVKCYTASLWTD